MIEETFSSKGRVRILRILAEIGELNVSELARRAKLNYATTTKHLRFLEESEIVTHRRYGRIRIYRFNKENPRVRAIQELIEVWKQSEKKFKRN